ncbi:MAG: hypothetical protein L0216_19260 [Planctomycetales bacterium]|nr:hypothetical protein [Planctomycetales bacterium]
MLDGQTPAGKVRLRQAHAPEAERAYVLSANETASEFARQSSSFVTAASALALLAARDFRVPVAADRIERTLDCRRKMRVAFDLLLDRCASYLAETGKTLTHCGPDGQGSHDLLFEYAHAAEAAARLLAETRERYRAPLLELVLACRREDGSFADNPILRGAAGAALALRALRSLEAGP